MISSVLGTLAVAEGEVDGYAVGHAYRGATSPLASPSGVSVSHVGCWQSASQQKSIHNSPQQLGVQHSPPAPLLPQVPQHIPVIVCDRNGVRSRRRRAEDYRRSSSATAIDCVAYCSSANCRRSFPTLYVINPINVQNCSLYIR